jgi:hypothetical protein
MKVLFTFLILASFIAHTQTLQRVKYTPDGEINSMAYNENYGLFIGGNFENWGINSGSMGLFTESNDIPIQSFPRFYFGGPNTRVSDGNGGWYIPNYNQARINENDSLSSLNTTIIHIFSNNKFDYNFISQFYNNGFVQMALHNGILYAVGNEVQISNGVYSSLLAFNATTGAFIPSPIVRGSTNSIVISGNTLYLSGNITQVNNTPINQKWIAINLSNGNLKNWNPFQNDSNYGWGGFKIYQTSGKIIIPYQRMDINKIGIAAFDTLSASTPIWKYEDSNTIATSLAISQDKIIFPKTDFQLGSRDMLLMAVNLSDGSLVQSWNSNNYRIRNLKDNNANVSGVKILNNNLYIAGRFDNVLSNSRNNIASINLITGTVNSWNPSPAEEMAFIETSGNNILCGTTGNCYFKYVKRPQIGIVNPITNEIVNNTFSFLPNFPLNRYSVGKLATEKEILWVGFNGPVFQNNQDIEAYDIRTGVKLNSPLTFSTDNYAAQSESKWIIVDSLLYIKPYVPFASNPTVNGQIRKGIFAISTSGTLQALNIDINPQSVNDFEIVDNFIYLCGSFTQINGVNQKYLARLNRFTGQLTNWNPNPERTIDEIEIVGNNVVFSGIQSYVGGYNNPNTNLNKTFFIDRLTGKFERSIDKPNYYGMGQKSGSLIGKGKYLFLGIDEGGFCTSSNIFSYGKGLTYYNIETKKYPSRCLISNYINWDPIDANKLMFVGSKLLFSSDYLSSNGNGYFYPGRQKIMKFTFPEGFFDDKLDYFPKRGHNGGSLTVHFYNYSIGYGTKIRLLKSGQSPITVNDSLSSYPEQFTLKTVLNLKGKATGDWDVELTLPTGEKIVVPNGFKINPPAPANIQVRLVAPSATRPGAPTKMTLVVSNLGEVDAYDVPIYLAYSKNVSLSAKISFWSNNKFNDVDTLSKFKLDTLITKPFDGWGSMLSLSQLGGGETFEIPLKAISDNTSSLNSLIVRAFTQNPTLSSNTSTSNLRLQATNNVLCNEPQNPCLIALTGALADAATTLLPPGPSNIVSCSLGTIGFIKEAICEKKTLSDHYGSISNVLWECSGLSGITAKLNILRIFGDKLNDAYSYLKTLNGVLDSCFPTPDPKKENGAEIPIVTSRDPNDKLGPVGVHSQRYVKGNDPMSYLIRFENYASATAAAQYVKVIDTLNVNKFDFSTFQFGYFNVADTNFYATPGRKTYMRDWDLRPAKNLILRMEAAFNDTTGILKATYTALDPATMEWTEDPFLGFLPPNVNAPEGEGGIFFTISPKTTLTHNEQITNKAYIYFDYNPAIPTPPWTNTLDKMIPSSQVQALPSVSRDTTLALSWAGNDVGAGTRLYDVYVSVNSNPYKLLIANSTLTNISFKGKPDSTYKFYSIAVDSVGNEEPIPVTFDTQTTIRLSSFIQSIKSGNWNDPTTWDCNCVPTLTNNVLIKASHTVSVTPSMGVIQAKIVQIESGGILNHRGNLMLHPD